MKTQFNIVVLLFGLLTACHQNTLITKREDYLKYLTTGKAGMVSNQKEITFWMDRLNAKRGDEASMLKLAGLFAEEFKSRGEISYLRKSDSLYYALLNKTSDKVAIYQSLAANAITQHKFREAQTLIEKALVIGDQKATSKLMMADITLELGTSDWTRKILSEFTNKSSFAWLIRKAKLKDLEGDLDSAIVLMERAYRRVKGNRSLASWTLSNLGDMYGHAGRVDDAYENYLKVLELNPDDDHSLKGIAWIALSHDHNVADARGIINYLSQKKRIPEGHLMLSELAAMAGDEKEKMRQLYLFKDRIDNPSYRLMYNKYLALIEAEDFKNPERCVAIAYEEIKNRPTPQSYDLLAWGYHLSGDNKKAMHIIENHVYKQTFEPESLYHMGMIYRANGFLEQGNMMLKEARKSSFELGPSLTKVIEETLNVI